MIQLKTFGLKLNLIGHFFVTRYVLGLGHCNKNIIKQIHSTIKLQNKIYITFIMTRNHSINLGFP